MARGNRRPIGDKKKLKNDTVLKEKEEIRN